MKAIQKYIDHTILAPTTPAVSIDQLCVEAKKYGFAAVCVPPFYVQLAKQMLLNTDVKVATVIGFPFGYSSTSAKLAEVRQAIADGADELDFVHNLAALKNDDWNYLSKEINTCLQPIRLAERCVKVIIESGMLTDKEIIQSCELYARHKVDFLKTSTGYAEKGARIESVKLMRKLLPEEIKIKASGGIRTLAAVQEYIEAGAERIGTSSGLQIMREIQKL